MKIKQTLIGGMTFIALTSTPFITSSFAMQGMDHSGMDHSGMEGMEMEARGADIVLKGDVQDGVKAQALLRDVSKAMAEFGGKETHHFMVEFTSGDGKKLGEGVAAVKIIDAAGNTSTPLKMMGMDDGFGVDVNLAKKGTYVFEVGTKLNDGKKRVFRFEHNNH
jgi:hypothetical protein